MLRQVQALGLFLNLRSTKVQTMCVFLTHMLAGANVMGGLEQEGKERESPVGCRAIRINCLTRVTSLRLYDSQLMPIRTCDSLESFTVHTRVCTLHTRV